MNNNKRSAGVYLAVACIVLAYIWGYSVGTGSKQPYIDSLNTHVTTLSKQVSDLKINNEHLESALAPYNPATPSDTDLASPDITQAPAVSDTPGCAVTTCVDGTCSYSTGRGTCSWHGGEAY